MKYFFLFIISLCTLQANAQDPELFDTTWYIHKITVDGTDTFIPSTIEIVEYDETEFFLDPAGMLTGYCDSFGMEVVFDPVDYFFESLSLVELGGTCNNIDNLNFTALYYYFLSVDNSTQIETFEYQITTSGDSKLLVLTNRLGDSVLYGDEVLGVVENTLPDITLYPNPVSNIIYVQGENITLSKGIVYDFMGKQLMEISAGNNVTAIPVKMLPAGMYFLSLTNDIGQKQVLRFIKE